MCVRGMVTIDGLLFISLFVCYFVVLINMAEGVSEFLLYIMDGYRIHRWMDATDAFFYYLEFIDFTYPL